MQTEGLRPVGLAFAAVIAGLPAKTMQGRAAPPAALAAGKPASPWKKREANLGR